MNILTVPPWHRPWLSEHKAANSIFYASICGHVVMIIFDVVFDFQVQPVKIVYVHILHLDGQNSALHQVTTIDLIHSVLRQ